MEENRNTAVADEVMESAENSVTDKKGIKSFKSAFEKIKKKDDGDGGKKGKSKKVKIIAAILVVVILLLIIVPKLGHKNDMPQMDTFTLVPAEKRDLVVSVSASGTVEPADSYTVMAFVKGEILNAPFEEGDIIEEDAVLYEIDASDMERSLIQAEMSISSAQRSYEKTLENMDDLNVKTKEAGRVARIYVEEGDSVMAGEVIADVLDSETMVLETSFLSVDANTFYIGQSATATITATGETLYGEVTWISGAEKTGVGGALVKDVEIKVYNPGGASPNMYAVAAVEGIACNNSGVLEYNAEVEVKAEVSGDVVKILAPEGTWVYKDDAIIQLENDDLTDQLINSGNSLTSARLSYDSTMDALEEYTITSPIAGTVIQKNFNEGDTIDATSDASSMAVIYDMSYMTIDLQIDELDIGSIEVGQRVVVTSDAFSRTFEGVVETRNIKGSSSNGVTTYPVTVRLDNYGELLPGMNVDAEIMVSETKGVLAIPTGAVSRGNTVLVQREGAKSDDPSTPEGFERVTVELGSTDGNFIEVISGLEEGDIVRSENSFTSQYTFGGMGGGMPMGGPMGGGMRP